MRDEGLEGLYLPEIRISPRILPKLIQTLTEFHLAIEITITAKPDEVVWQLIHQELARHATNRNFSFPSYSLSSTLYSESPFVLLCPGYNSDNGRKLNESPLQGYEITPENLWKTASKVKHPERNLTILCYSKFSIAIHMSVVV